MATPFDRQMGAAGDVRELEYISALHQTTEKEVRRDASIKAEDIQRFLMSRYGIKVTPEEVSETILHGLGGASDQDDVLDLMEIVAMLLIPIFLKAARMDYLTNPKKSENQDAGKDEKQKQPADRLSDMHTTSPLDDELVPTPPGLLDFVLKMILHDVTGDRTPKRLTPNLIRRILLSHGEIGLANHDELVEEMFEAATSFETTDEESPNPMLNAETFGTALTHDIQLYDIRNETRLTTNFSDVYLTDEKLAEREEEVLKTTNTSEDLIQKDKENQAIRAKVQLSEKIERVNTVPFIDTTAGTYRSKELLVSLWATILITYFAYFYLGFLRPEKMFQDFCSEHETDYTFNSSWVDNSEAIGCEAGKSIVQWMSFFFGFSIFGLICVYLGSIGNAEDFKVIWRPMLSFVFMLLLATVPFLIVFLRTDGPERHRVLYVASLVFGLVTSAFCLHRAAELYFSVAQMENFQVLSAKAPCFRGK